ncbi:hypothetical protein BN1723_006170, partial [Verticillium longisporum]
MVIVPGGLAVGANGIHVCGNTLFYASLDQGLFASIPISLADGTPPGPVDIIVNSTLLGADDFTLPRDGTKAWVAGNGNNVIKEIGMFNKTSTLTANSALLSSTSSVALGRTCSDWDNLYISGASNIHGSPNARVSKATGLQ